MSWGTSSLSSKYSLSSLWAAISKASTILAGGFSVLELQAQIINNLQYKGVERGCRRTKEGVSDQVIV
jgi:hypothetical protein